MSGSETGASSLPGQLPRLTHEKTARVQAETLASPRPRYGMAARALFLLLDTLYGKPALAGCSQGHGSGPKTRPLHHRLAGRPT